MKDFVKIMLASAVGFLIAQVILSFVAMIFFVGMLGTVLNSVSSDKFTLQENTVLNLRLDGSIVEQHQKKTITSLLSDDFPAETGLNDIGRYS